MFSYSLVRPCHVVGLHRQHFLQRVGGAVGLQRPHLHLAETPGRRNCALPPSGLLRHQRVRAGRAGVHLVVDQVVQLQHVHVADGDRALDTSPVRPSYSRAWVRVAVRPSRCATYRPDRPSRSITDSDSEAPSNTGVRERARRRRGGRPAGSARRRTARIDLLGLPDLLYRSPRGSWRTCAALAPRTSSPMRCRGPSAQPGASRGIWADVHPRRHARAH